MADDIFAPPTKEELADNNADIFAPPSESELKSSNVEQPSFIEAASKGLAEGLTLGFDDELAGILEAGGQSIGVKGAGAPNLSDIELQTPKGLNLQELMSAYKSARDKRRELSSKAQQAHPGTFLAANLGGALLPNPAGLLAKGGTKGAAALGGLAGLGMSESDLTEGDITGAAKDIGTGAILGTALSKVMPANMSGTLAGAGLGGATGAATGLAQDNITADDMVNRTLTGAMVGAGVGAAGQAGVKGIKSLIGKIAPEKMQTAYQAGLAGENLLSKQGYENVLKEAEDVTSTLAKPILNEKQRQQEIATKAKLLFDEQTNDTVTNFQKQMDDLLAKQKLLEENYTASQTSKISQARTELAKNRADIADSINTDLNKMNKSNMMDLNNIYKAADEAGATVNTVDALSKFKDNVTEVSERALEKLTSYEGDIPLTKLRTLKELMFNLTENGTSADKRLAREAYASLNDTAITSLSQNETTANLAQALSQANQKARALINFNDEFAKYASAEDAKSKANLLLEKLQKAKAQAKSEADVKSIAEAQMYERAMTPALEKVNPELAQTVGMAADDLRLSNEAINQIPTKLDTSDIQARYKLLQDKLAEAKAQKIPVDETEKLFSNFSNDEKALMSQIRPLLKKVDTQSGDLNAEAKLKQIFEAYKNTHGDQKSNELLSKMQKLADKIDIVGASDAMTDIPNSASTYGIVKAIKSFLPKAANVAGTAVKKVDEALISGAKNLDGYISKVGGKTDATSNLVKSMLMKIKEMPVQKQDAAMFALLQNPAYRAVLSDNNNQEQAK